jgi:archaellum component FlaC
MNNDLRTTRQRIADESALATQPQPFRYDGGTPTNSKGDALEFELWQIEERERKIITDIESLTVTIENMEARVKRQNLIATGHEFEAMEAERVRLENELVWATELNPQNRETLAVAQRLAGIESILCLREKRIDNAKKTANQFSESVKEMKSKLKSLMEERDSLAKPIEKLMHRLAQERSKH